MTENTKPQFNDILNLIQDLPDYPAFHSDTNAPLSWLSEWLKNQSVALDFSKGFNVNRCALYWAGYDQTDGFDGQAFVDSCQDSHGGLRQLAEILDTDLQIFELDPHNTDRPSVDDIAMAASYGMMGIEEGTQLFMACSFGQGVSIAAQNALKEVENASLTLEEFLTTHCGLDIAAMMGGAIACILKGIPMIIEGDAGQLVKTLLEKETGKTFPNIISCNDFTSTFFNHDIPGYKILTTAIMLKTLYAGSLKTDCGKVKQAA